MPTLRHLFLAVAKRIGLSRLIPDKPYLKMLYRDILGKKLDLDNPKTFCEKLQWLKLYDRKEEYSALVDKYAVKKIVAERIGNEYVVPLLGVWDRADDIDFAKLPERYVLKTTHDSGGIFICKDKNQFNQEEARKAIRKNLKRNFYYLGREWPYKNIKPRVIAEQFLESEPGKSINDYKVMCFEGEPKFIQAHTGRFENHVLDYYDTEWNKSEMYSGYESTGDLMEKPVFLEEMLELSRKLAKGLHQIRVDWYYVNGQLYFGELTFFDGSGFDEFHPDRYNELMGSWIHLDNGK